MSRFFTIPLFLGAFFFSAFLGSSALQAKEIPAAPYYYVLDEPKILSQNATMALQRLLIEHDRLTGEQFLIAIFNSLDGEDPIQFTNEVFASWKIGQRGKDNGILLALYWSDRRARIEVGYGMEAMLTDAKAKTVLEDFLIPGLKAQQPSDALAAATLEILRLIESPLIQSGQAEQILKSGSFQSLHSNGWGKSQGLSAGWIVLLILGVGFLFWVLQIISAAEAHFTGSGWYKPTPWDQIRRAKRQSWGGFGGWSGGGGGGGFGGFSGGGGRSGGGGASGSW